MYHQEIKFKEPGQAKGVYDHLKDGYRHRGECAGDYVRLQGASLLVTTSGMGDLEKALQRLEGKGVQLKIKERKPYRE